MGLLSRSLSLLLFSSAFQDFSVFEPTVLKRRGVEEMSHEEIRSARVLRLNQQSPTAHRLSGEKHKQALFL